MNNNNPLLRMDITFSRIIMQTRQNFSLNQESNRLRNLFNLMLMKLKEKNSIS